MVPCRLFEGPLDSSGYGRVCRHGREFRAHRIAWIDAFGLIPDGLDVLHACDTPACIEPRHLLLGTHTANMLDRDRKRRHAAGKRNGRSLLTEAQVLEIRMLRNLYTKPQLAGIYGVSVGCVQDALGRNWKDLPPVQALKLESIPRETLLAAVRKTRS